MRTYFIAVCLVAACCFAMATTPEDVVQETVSPIKSIRAAIESDIVDVSQMDIQLKMNKNMKTPSIDLSQVSTGMLAGKSRNAWKHALFKAYKRNPKICKDWLPHCHMLRMRIPNCNVRFACGRNDLAVHMKKACCSTCNADARIYCKDKVPWCSYLTDTKLKRKKYCNRVVRGKTKPSLVGYRCQRSCKMCWVPPLKTVAVKGKTKKKLIRAARKETLAESVLRTTNIYRCMHGVPPVKWSSAVAESAQKWADKGVYKHSKSYQVPTPAGPAGENLALGHETIAEANKAWYKEVNNCVRFPGCRKRCKKKEQERAAKQQARRKREEDEDDETNKDGETFLQKGPIGHFTALIWKGVKEIGCGTSKVNGRNMYVCRYRSGPELDCNTPNMRGCYRENVLQQVKTKKQCWIPPPAAPAGQPGQKASACKAKDAKYSYPVHLNRPYIHKVYMKKTYSTRCAYAKATGRCKHCVKGVTPKGLCQNKFAVNRAQSHCRATCNTAGKKVGPTSAWGAFGGAGLPGLPGDPEDFGGAGGAEETGDDPHWTKGKFSAYVQDLKTGKLKTLSQTKYPSRCAYFAATGQCFKNGYRWLSKCPASCLCDKNGNAKASLDPRNHKGYVDPAKVFAAKKKIAERKGVKNYARDCWGGCHRKQGPCNWCGTGLCCRFGWSKAGDGCKKTDGIKGKGHVCVAKPKGWVAPKEEGGYGEGYGDVEELHTTAP